MKKFQYKLPLPTRVDAGAYYHGAEMAKMLYPLFTFRDRFGVAFSLAKKTKTGILIPREVVSEGWQENPKIDKRTRGTPIVTSSTFKPRSEEQQRVVDECIAWLQKGVSLIAQASVGFGKTVIAMQIIHLLGVKTAIVVPKEDIKIQWLNVAVNILGIKPQQVGYIQGSRSDVAGKKIVICMLQSVCKENRYPTWVFRDFGLVIFDEVHRVASTEFNKAIWNFPARLRLGLSATARRRDGRDRAFTWHIGEVLVHTDMMVLKPKVLVGGFVHGSLSRIHVKPGRTAIANRILSKSTVRNRAIADWAKVAYTKDRIIIIFSDLLSHLSVLYDYLINRQIPPEDIAYYVGGMKEDEREKAKRKRILLATYKMASEATDIPWLDTAILALPRSDIIQIVGRILREYEDKKPPVVFDILDKPNSIFLGYFRKRLAWYAQIGAEVKYLRG